MPLIARGRSSGRLSARTAAVAASMAVLLACAAASAQPAGETRGQVLFREGREAMERGDLETACARFDESHRLEGAVGPLLNLANCEEKRGKLTAALAAYARALVILRPDQVDQRALADERVRDLTERVPTLALRLAPGAPPGTTARVDGATVPLDARPRPYEAGSHQLEVVAPGRERSSTTVDLALRDRRAIAVEPGAAGSPEPAPPPARSSSGVDSFFVGGLVAGGVGLAGLGVFAATGLVALDASSTLDDACPEHRCPPGDTEGHDAADTGDAMLVPNAVGLGVGIVGVGLGVTLLVLSGDEDASSALTVGPSGGSLRARF